MLPASGSEDVLGSHTFTASVSCALLSKPSVSPSFTTPPILLSKKPVIILICTSHFDRTILIPYVLKLHDGNDTCKNDLLLSITSAGQQLGVGAGIEWRCQQVLFYSVRCQPISKISKARKNRKNCMVGEIAAVFAKDEKCTVT